MQIDIELNDIHPDTDVETLVSYLAALLQQQTKVQVQPNIIDTDYVDPIRLAQALRGKPSRPGGDY